MYSVLTITNYMPSLLIRKQRHASLHGAHYPHSYKDAKNEEFLKLIQGLMTVAEYRLKFIEFSKYAQVLVDSEIDKCRWFEKMDYRRD